MFAARGASVVGGGWCKGERGRVGRMFDAGLPLGEEVATNSRFGQARARPDKVFKCRSPSLVNGTYEQMQVVTIGDL